MCWTDETLQKQDKDWNVKWKDSGCIRLTKMQWVSMDKQLNASGQVSQHFHHCLFFNNSSATWKKRNIQREDQGPDHLHVNVQRHWMDNERWELRMLEKSRITKWDSRKDIGHSWVQGRKKKKKWCGRSSRAQGQWTCTANKMVQQIQRNWSSCVQQYQCVESWKVKHPFTSTDTADTIVRKSLLPISCGSRETKPNSIKWGRRMENKYSFSAENIRVLDLIRKPKLWQLFPKAQSVDQFWKFILWKFLTDMEQKLRCHQSQIHGHILRRSIQRNRTFREWNSWSQGRAQVQWRIAQRPSRIRKWILWRRNMNLEHQGNLCLPSQHSTSKSIPIHKTNHFYEWEEMEGHSSAFLDGGYLAVVLSKMVPKMQGHSCGIPISPELMK